MAINVFLGVFTPHEGPGAQYLGPTHTETTTYTIPTPDKYHSQTTLREGFNSFIHDCISNMIANIHN